MCVPWHRLFSWRYQTLCYLPSAGWCYQNASPSVVLAGRMHAHAHPEIIMAMFGKLKKIEWMFCVIKVVDLLQSLSS